MEWLLVSSSHLQMYLQWLSAVHGVHYTLTNILDNKLKESLLNMWSWIQKWWLHFTDHTRRGFLLNESYFVLYSIESVPIVKYLYEPVIALNLKPDGQLEVGTSCEPLSLSIGCFKTWSDEWMGCRCSSHHFTRDYANFFPLRHVANLCASPRRW